MGIIINTSGAVVTQTCDSGHCLQGIIVLRYFRSVAMGRGYKIAVVVVSLLLAANSAGALTCSEPVHAHAGCGAVTANVCCCAAAKTAERTDAPNLSFSSMPAEVPPVAHLVVGAAARDSRFLPSAPLPRHDNPSLLCTFLI